MHNGYRHLEFDIRAAPWTWRFRQPRNITPRDLAVVAHERIGRVITYISGDQCKYV